MPTPRMTTAFAAAGTTTFGKSTFGKSTLVVVPMRAVIVGKVSDLNNTYYLDLNGSVVRGEASIDAALTIGSVVWTMQGDDGTYVIQGTA